MKKTISLAVCLLAIGCAKGNDGANIKGPQGDPGKSCSVSSVAGGALILCPDGTNQFVSNGTNGSNGVDETPVTVVQFCQGAPSYPSRFLEVGLVISGKIYGVYSLNDGFLTYLPPGNYNSNAVGSNCNFTINSNNTITN